MVHRVYQEGVYQIGATLTLNERAAHHVRVVLRKQLGDPLILFPQGAVEWTAHLIAINKKEVVVQLTACHEVQRESGLSVCLAHSLCAGDKMDWVIQKSVELGVKAIMPILSERSVACSATHALKKHQHWQGVIQHAVEQSGRTQLPLLHPLTDLHQCLASTSYTQRWMLDPHTPSDVATRLQAPKPDQLMVLIGPEGGWSDAERQEMLAHQVLPIQLGPRILRTETAAVVMLSVLQLQWGDF